MNYFTKNKKALISAVVILVIALVTSFVASPADSGDSGVVIFLLVSSSILFIRNDRCSKTQLE